MKEARNFRHFTQPDVFRSRLALNRQLKLTVISSDSKLRVSDANDECQFKDRIYCTPRMQRSQSGPSTLSALLKANPGARIPDTA